MMGNSPSASDNEEDDTTSHEEDKDDSFNDDIDSSEDNTTIDSNNFGVKEDTITAPKSDADDENGPNTCSDLNQLYDHKSLRRFASKLKDDVPINVIQQNHSHVIRWLENSVARNEETVTLSQFCDFLSTRSVGRAQAVQAFNQFDTEGDGTADVSTMLDALKSSSGPNLHGELNYVIRTLQGCPLIPGFIDVYSEDKSSGIQHGLRILNFLIRNRASTDALPFQVLDGFNNTSSMRQSVLKSTFSKLAESANKQITDNLFDNGAELRAISKTFSRVEVSSNTADASRLTNGDFSSYWQSDGLARSHWIRLWIKNNVVLKQLSIAVSSSDQSYMPQIVSVSVGRSPNNLTEIKEVRIPSHVKGDVQLAENLPTYYRCIQITILRCQSDGCDTRIRSIKTLGYRVIKDQGFSVLDASAVWYLRVMASTIAATRTMVPSLRLAILDHSESALQHMPPLSLSQASSSKPHFLSAHVLDEVDKFLAEISVDENKQLSSSGFLVLLSLSLARGHVSSILQILQRLVENSNLSIPCVPLFQSMVKVKESFYRKSANQLTVTLLGSDGGQKDESSPASLVLSGNWMAPANFYQTKEGKTKVNMFFKGQSDIQLVKLQLKVEKGSKGPKLGMVFVYRDSDKDFDLDKHVERFATYDSWKITNHNQAVAAAKDSGEKKPDDPVAFFVMEDAWDELEIVLDYFLVGQNVLIKFLEPRQSSADRLGIIGVKFYGFERKDYQSFGFNAEELCEEAEMTSQEIVQKTVMFLRDIASEQPVSRRGVFNKKQWLDMSKLTIDTVWQLYKSYTDTYSNDDLKTSSLILQLLHALLPHFAATKPEEKGRTESCFKHLCEMLDKSPDDKVAAALMPTVRQVMVDGVSIFFPDKEARRKELFGMIDNISGCTDTPPSVQLIFQSLCQYYSSVDPTALLDLPKTLEPEFDSEPFMIVMDTLCAVVLREFKLFLDTTEMTEQSSHLLNLVCSLQTSLLSWCQRQMTASDEKEKQEEIQKKNKKIVEPLILRYSQMLISKADDGLGLLSKVEEKDLSNCIEKMDRSFLSTAFRQLILLLSTLSKHSDSPSSVKLLKTLLSVAEKLKEIAGKAPSFFEQVNKKDLESLNTQEVVLRTWDIESPHNYHNNQHTLQVFYCPGATKFILEFDPRCETEKRYDYLEFTDARGYKIQYDQKTGSDKWPKTVRFRGPYLQFLFHSDGSSTEWGYKFTVQAKGCPDIPLSWIYDLQLGISKFMGQLCSEVLDSKKVVSHEDPLQDDKAQKEVSFLRNDLWTALFRGGDRIGKFQRSLSGKYGALNEDCSVHSFLWQVLKQENDLAKGLIKKCQEHCQSNHAGGEAVDAVVIGVFGGLLWHTQALREDMEKYISSGGESVLSEGVFQAYTAAESVRNFLLYLRQKKKLADEKEEKNEDTVDYVQQFRGKAEYLLKFAGLTKIQPKTEFKVKTMKSFKKNRKLSAAMIERQQSVYENPINDKYPSFRLVIDFIQDPAITTDKVHDLLQQRAQHAESTCNVYETAAKFIQQMADPHIFQIPTVMFLKEMLKNQENFAKHYADGIEGSGLDLESKVRRSYYSLLKKLIESLDKFDRAKATIAEVSAYDYIRACLLHFLDVNWQPYDFAFLLELKIPQLFMNIAKGSVATRSRGSGDYKEEDEMKDYERNMKWLEESKGNFEEWHENCTKTNKKVLPMFIARFCDLLDVEIGCDGCHVTLPGRRYRCLQCDDVDLCATCFAGGVSPVGEHNDDHEMVHLMFKCNACGAFIVGQRVHCDICDDFDLCFGCHTKGNLTSGHTADHSVTRFPMVTLTSSKKCDSTLQAYIHQHVWLLFTSLTLNMASIVYAQPSPVDADYQETASQIHDMCTAMVISCLELVPLSDELLHEDSLVEDPEKSGKLEIAFALHSQERIMGLLGAMIPAEHVPFLFHTEKFLKLLFSVASGESGHEVNTQHLAMGLLRHLLQRVAATCEVCDNAVVEATGRPLEEGKKEGWHTIKYLFDFGAKCLERSSIEWAYSVASILQGLFNSSAWRDVLMDHVKTSIQGLTSAQDLSSIFALIVVAGFPDILSVGTNVKCTIFGLESRNGVVLKHFPEKRTTLVVDKATRRRHLVIDEYIDVSKPDLEIPDLQHTSALIDIIKDIGGRLRKDATSDVGVESLWVLGLALKALIKTGTPEDITSQNNPLYEMDFIQCIVHLASRGTDFEKLWLLKDLEVLSLMLYTADKQGTSTIPGKTRTASKSEKEKGASAATNVDTADSAAKETIDLISGYAQVLQATLNPLAAIMDENYSSATDVLRELARKDLGRPGLSRPEDIHTALTQTMDLMRKLRTPEAPSSIMVDKSIDTGIQLSGVTPLDEHEGVTDVVEAVDEPCEKTQNLVTKPDNDVKKEVEKQRKQKSAELFKKALEAQGKAMNRDYLMKVNLAIAVLYAREVLISLLAEWPADGEHIITAQLLGCSNDAQIPCVIDMLNRTESRDTINKLVQNLIKSCDPSCLVSIAMTGCHFLEELSLMCVSRDSEHPYKNNTNLTDKIHIPGATFLSVKFDKRCVTEETCDDLVMSTSADYAQDKHVFSGAKDRWVDFEVPGDTLYFKFSTDCSNTDWGYKFSVTGGKTGRFDTGYMILDAILSAPDRTSLLPLDQLWSSLIQVVCKQTGSHRLKIIQLLLHILNTQCCRDDCSPLVIDICLLQPLWQLYTKMSGDPEPGTITTPLVRALTELFFVAENLALVNDIAERYAASLKTKEEWKELLLEGVVNVAAVGAAINYANIATNALQAKRNADGKKGKEAVDGGKSSDGKKSNKGSEENKSP